jgi:hypothetical protein
MSAFHDSLFNFLQLCLQVIQVITAVVFFVVRYTRNRKASFQQGNRKEERTPLLGEPKGVSMASPLVVEQD